MLGKALKFSFDTKEYDFSKTIAPTEFYFPMGTWCQVYPAVTTKSPCVAVTDDQPMTLGTETKIDSAYIHLRSGMIIPHQDSSIMVDDKPILSVHQLNHEAATNLIINPTVVATPFPVVGTVDFATGTVAVDMDGSGDALAENVSVTKVTLSEEADYSDP